MALIAAVIALALVLWSPEGVRLAYAPQSSSADAKIINTTVEDISHLLDKNGIKSTVTHSPDNQSIWVDLHNRKDASKAKTLIDAAKPLPFNGPSALQFRVVLDSKTAAEAQNDPSWAVTTGENLKPESEIILPSSEGGTELHLKLGPSLMTGDAIKKAQVGHDTSNRPKIDFSLTSNGTTDFARITQENLNKQLAIVFNYKVLSAPNIKEAITSGAGEITGKFTDQEVKNIAKAISPVSTNLLLPIPLKLVE